MAKAELLVYIMAPFQNSAGDHFSGFWATVVVLFARPVLEIFLLFWIKTCGPFPC